MGKYYPAYTHADAISYSDAESYRQSFHLSGGGRFAARQRLTDGISCADIRVPVAVAERVGVAEAEAEAGQFLFRET